MGSSNRLMLIDGHALVHRAFHALPEDLSTSSGEPTNAVLGFSNILLKEIETLKPTHIVLAFDRPVPTFRHRAYAEYKATRAKTPPALVPQFARVREIVGALRIPIAEIDGFEADDVLGTLAKQASDENLETVIITGDLDALQLVSDRVHVRTPGRGFQDSTTYDPERVQERYGIEPHQLPDWKALVGDTSDNIPGVKGIGAKSATQLLQQYGSLEGVYEHLDELAPRLRLALESAEEQALQSRTLARIVCDVPVNLDLPGSQWGEIDKKQLINVFLDLEFHRLIERIQTIFSPAQDVAPASQLERGTSQLSMFDGADSASSASGVAVARTLDLLDDGPHRSVSTHTRVVRTREELQEMKSELTNSGRFAVDTETTSTDALQAALVGLSFACTSGQAWYVPVGHAEGKQLADVEVIEVLRPILEDASLDKIGHNLKYDVNVLARYGVHTTGIRFDTMIAAYLVNPSARGLSLSSLAMSRLGIEMTPIETLIGKGKSQITMNLVDIDTVAAYAGADADVTLQLAEGLEAELVKNEVKDLFESMEMPLVSVLASMEREGVALDTEVLSAMSRDMTETLGNLEAKIYETAGYRFNINSTQQLGQLLFQQLKLPSGRRTKTGYSTDNEVLEGLRGKHEIVDAILEYRQLIKLKNTYIDALPLLINPASGRVHTDFNQTIASTGRLSSSNPNLQNIPIRGEMGRRIRRAFVPRSADNVLLAADYSQIELRILASMSGDERLVAAFRSGEDIHRATASAVFSVAPGDVTPDQRRIAKVVNFGIIYGIGESRLAFETGITRSEAREFIESYNQTYAGVKRYMDSMRKRAALYGYVLTLFNRRRYIPDIHASNPGIRTAAERAAINMPIQGTAADIIKIAMIHLHDALRANEGSSYMVLQVHDELVFDLPAGSVDRVAGRIRETMVHAADLSVPLEVEMKVGKDWYDMSPIVGG